MANSTIFDEQSYQRRNAALTSVLRSVLPGLRERLHLETALHVGCGAGYFSALLAELGIQVQGVDGREENVRTAQLRLPSIPFRVANVEELDRESLGTFDLVFCFGLLYHLENPFRAIRNLYRITGKMLLVESMCIPEEGAQMHLLEEGRLADQALQYVAIYPSETALVKMLRHAGFAHVYCFRSAPDHIDFQRSFWRKPVRTLLLASNTSLDNPALTPAPEVSYLSHPYGSSRYRFPRIATLLSRLARTRRNGNRQREKVSSTPGS